MYLVYLLQTTKRWFLNPSASTYLGMYNVKQQSTYYTAMFMWLLVTNVNMKSQNISSKVCGKIMGATVIFIAFFKSHCVAMRTSSDYF